MNFFTRLRLLFTLSKADRQFVHELRMSIADGVLTDDEAFWLDERHSQLGASDAWQEVAAELYVESVRSATRQYGAGMEVAAQLQRIRGYLRLDETTGAAGDRLLLDLQVRTATIVNEQWSAQRDYARVPLEGNATPKQVAFLTFMGMPDAAKLSKEAASQKIEATNHIQNLDEMARSDARKGEWRTARFLLYPALYEPEFQEFLGFELANRMHALVRRNVKNAEARLTKSKVVEVITALTREDRDWWSRPTCETRFFDRLKILHPGCCRNKFLVPDR